MISIVTFGNCQADALSRLIGRALPDDGYATEFVSNNQRTGGMKSPEEILERVAGADYLLFQPLSAEHGPLREESVRETATGRLVSFPYLFNSGIVALCHNDANARKRVPRPERPKVRPKAERVYGNRPFAHAYGNIYGEEPVLEMLDAGWPAAEIKAAYLEGSIDFDLQGRFDWCLAELRRREEAIDIRVADHIEARYRRHRQFLTHNHPTTDLLVEILRQFRELTDLPIDLDSLRTLEDENAAELPGGRLRCPVSPHDALDLGYGFGHDPDWRERGLGLVSMICEEYVLEGAAETV